MFVEAEAGGGEVTCKMDKDEQGKGGQLVFLCFCFERRAAYKGVLQKKSRRHFFSHLTFFNEHVNIAFVILHIDR